MSGYDIRRLPFLTDLNGRLVGVISANGQEVFFPTFTPDQLSLLKPDGSVLAGQGGGPTYTLPPATTSTLGGLKVGSGLAVSADGTVMVTAGGGSTSYTLPPATTTTLGGIKVGANLTVGTDGTLNASAGGGVSGSVRVVYTSSTCTSDADVSLNSTNLGTDQGAKLQAILDLALLGPLLVMWDGAYGVSPQFSDTALAMHSNTYIQALPNCGAILQGNTQVNLISNYDRDDGRGTGTSFPNNKGGNKTLGILGGLWNGNGNSARIIQMMGVDGFRMQDVKLLNSGHFHFHAGNWKNFTMENIYINKGTGAQIFSDGLHYCGPGDNLYQKNVTVLGCADDNFALNADDAWVGNTETYQPRGPITNVLADGLTMQSNLYGVRILSGGSLVDNIDIRRVRGTCVGYACVIDNFIPAQTATTGPGAIRTVKLSDFDVEVTPGGDANLKGCIVVDCKVERLVLNDFRRSLFQNTQYDSIQFGTKANIGQLVIDKYMSSPFKGGTYLASQFNFKSGAVIGSFQVTNSLFNSPTAYAGYPITVQSGATISQLIGVGNMGTGFTDFIQNSGTITNLHFPATANFMDAAPSSSSTWTLDAGYTEVSDSALTFAGSIATIQTATKKLADTFSANIQVTCRMRFTGTNTSALHSAILLRAGGMHPYTANGSFGYVFDIDQIGSAVAINAYAAAGGGGTKATVSGAALAMNTDYDVTAIAKGSLLTMKIQRVSDGFWMQTNGTFAATAASVMSVTDTTFGSGTGLLHGVYSYAYNANAAVSGVNFTNYTAIAAP